MQIPVIPTFVDGDTSVAKLRQLSEAVSFVSNAEKFPMWHFYRTSTFTMATAGTWYTVPMNVTAFDSDRVGSNGTVTIVTQGYYSCEACLPFQTQTVVNNAVGSFLFTAGVSNPHYSSGTQIVFGLKYGRMIAGTGMDEAVTLDDLCPVVCFPGDTIAVQAQGGVANTVIDINNPVGATEGRFVPNFTGRWVRVGS